MDAVHYGHADFSPNTHFVRANRHDGAGQVAEGFGLAGEARALAERLAADVAMQDVIVVTEDRREAVVNVFKGVQWFCERELRIKYGDRLRIASSPPPTETIPIPGGPAFGDAVADVA